MQLYFLFDISEQRKRRSYDCNSDNVLFFFLPFTFVVSVYGKSISKLQNINQCLPFVFSIHTHIHAGKCLIFHRQMVQNAIFYTFSVWLNIWERFQCNNLSEKKKNLYFQSSVYLSYCLTSCFIVDEKKSFNRSHMRCFLFANLYLKKKMLTCKMVFFVVVVKSMILILFFLNTFFAWLSQYSMSYRRE